MTSRSGMCASFMLELLEAIHDFRVDTIKVALYSSLADISPDTTAYTSTEEVTDGSTWPSGGKQLAVAAGSPKKLSSGDKRYGVTGFDTLTVGPTTLTFRTLLIYNASKANRAIAVLDRGVDVVVTAGNLSLANNANYPYLVQISS